MYIFTISRDILRPAWVVGCTGSVAPSAGPRPLQTGPLFNQRSFLFLPFLSSLSTHSSVPLKFLRVVSPHFSFFFVSYYSFYIFFYSRLPQLGYSGRGSAAPSEDDTCAGMRDDEEREESAAVFVCFS